jgi:excisionase family DNA binding protein
VISQSHFTIADKAAKTQSTLTRRMLRCKEAARYLSVGTKRIRQLVLSGELPCIRMDDAQNSPFLIDVRDLDRWIDLHKSQ